MQEQRERSVLTVEQGVKFSLTLVESVDSFSENNLVLTASGQKITLTGTNFKILSFSKGNGNFSASGEVSSVRYGKGKGKWTGLFK